MGALTEKQLVVDVYVQVIAIKKLTYCIWVWVDVEHVVGALMNNELATRKVS
jgi:hypothetical protein